MDFFNNVRYTAHPVLSLLIDEGHLIMMWPYSHTGGKAVLLITMQSLFNYYSFFENDVFSLDIPCSYCEVVCWVVSNRLWPLSPLLWNRGLWLLSRRKCQRNESECFRHFFSYRGLGFLEHSLQIKPEAIGMCSGLSADQHLWSTSIQATLQV